MVYAFRPNAVTEIRGRALTAAEAGLQRLTVSLGLGRHGHAELALWPGSTFADAAVGDAITLALGPAGREVAVLTGTVSARRRETRAVVIEALDLGGALSRVRKTITFEETSIDDIVRRIAEEASMQVESDASDTLSIYYLQAHRPLWDHLRDLSALSGRDLGVDPDGVLLFRQPEAGETRTLRFGAELLDWRFVEDESPAPVTRAPHGTKSESGNWHWVNPDPLGEDPGAARIDGTLTDRDIATTAADAAAARAGRATFGGFLLITGDAGIRPADSAAVIDLPGGDPEPLRICGVRHTLDGAGFRTRLEVEGGGSGGGLLGGLL